MAKKTSHKKAKSAKKARRAPRAAKRNSAAVPSKRAKKVAPIRHAPPKPATQLTRVKDQDKVKALITLGKERGYITYDEILREFPTIEDNVVLLEEMYERFGTAGIDVLEGGGMLEDTGADTVLEKKKLQNMLFG